MFVPVGRRAIPGRFISVPFPTRQHRLSPGVCPDCEREYSYCECEPGASEPFAEHIDRLNAEHIAACAAAPLPYRPLGSLLCRTCGNELATCACFDGDELLFSFFTVDRQRGRSLRLAGCGGALPPSA